MSFADVRNLWICSKLLLYELHGNRQPMETIHYDDKPIHNVFKDLDNESYEIIDNAMHVVEDNLQYALHGTYYKSNMIVTSLMEILYKVDPGFNYDICYDLL